VIKAEFSASLLHSSVSHDPSEITLKIILDSLKIIKKFFTCDFFFTGYFDE